MQSIASNATTSRVLLGVNIDHVATLRQARGVNYPDPILAAMLAEEAGADGITLHLREDRRHIQDADVFALKERLSTRMNLEMAVTDEMLDMACEVKPAYCCLVPEKREELTTEGGLDVAGQQERIKEACNRLTKAGIQVSLFIDPDAQQLRAAQACGAPLVEIHTGAYVDAKTYGARQLEFERIVRAVELGNQLDLVVNAGHGLTYHNVEAIAGIPNIYELNIGHAIIARAVFVGLKEAVREMRKLIAEASR